MIKYISSKRLQNRWLNRDVLKSCKYKSILFKNLKLGLVTHNDYKNYCNKLKTVINNAKTNYYNNAFSNYKNNIKQTWKLINDLICSRKSRN